MANVLAEDFDTGFQNIQKALAMEARQPQATIAKIAILCAHPNPKVRNGRRALALAMDYYQETKMKYLPARLLVAYAHAEVGEFDKAINVLSQALKDPELDVANKGKIKSCLEKFKQKQPMRIDFLKERSLITGRDPGALR